VHHLYQTKAYVLGAAATGEANMMCRLFTRDLGFVAAFAQGVRLAKSKMAGHLTPGTFVQVSLVRGKELWRLVGAIEIAAPKDEMTLEERVQRRAFWARISKFLNRFVQGEDPHVDVFDDVEAIGQILVPDFVAHIRTLECLFVLRSMYRFGYIAPGVLVEFTSGALTAEMVVSFVQHQHAALALINKALKESHL
jgi:recombinational DNA repair protein (RecF pathway)